MEVIFKCNRLVIVFFIDKMTCYMGKFFGENNIWVEFYRIDGILVVVMIDILVIGNKINK